MFKDTEDLQQPVVNEHEDNMKGARLGEGGSNLRRTRLVLMLNVVVLSVLALIVFITSVYATSQFASRSFFTFVASNIAWLGIFASIVCLAGAICACIALRWNSRVCFAMTALISLGFIILQIASMVLLTNFSNTLQIGSPGVPSAMYTNPGDIVINNLAFSMYVKCCTGCPTGCNNTTPGAFSNVTLSYCAFPNTCASVGACNSPTQNNCFVHSSLGRLPRNFSIPTSYVNDYVCSSLQSMNLNGAALVGAASTGACGGGDPSQFLQNLSAYLKSSVSAILGVYIFVALLQFGMLFLGCYMSSVPQWITSKLMFVSFSKFIC